MPRRVVVNMNLGAHSAAPTVACPSCAASWASPSGYTTRLVPHALCRCSRRHHELRCKGCGRDFVVHRQRTEIYLTSSSGDMLRYCREQDRLVIAADFEARLRHRG